MKNYVLGNCIQNRLHVKGFHLFQEKAQFPVYISFL